MLFVIFNQAQTRDSFKRRSCFMVQESHCHQQIIKVTSNVQLQLVKVVEALANSNYKVKGACLDAVYEWVNHKWTTVHYQDVLLLTLCLAPLGFLHL
ncbi:hypothetical protein OUZ56_017691 [Daphnia magna]|uniref:Uncharacterized protein n=1 Tax=Daphnia magna TaxID=35525 RepID=A0ABR0ATH2_9CRUS|nr:hypothetical protein OUZ56_017691 [Daphnia magna]